MNLVGGERKINVLDVKTQENKTMSLKKFVQNFLETKPARRKLLNVLSLEFSNSDLDKFVERPPMIDEIDLIEITWPQKLKQKQIDSKSNDSKTFPKVQKYCLMSVEKCYTDFHIDFGGTSTWFYISSGKKIFWLIEPTEENLQAYEDWADSDDKANVFFADKVSECELIRMKKGDFYMMPSGWIHAVYTPKDSIVFSGSFMCSLTVPTQLKIYELEDRRGIEQKFRFPFFKQLLWYVLDKFVVTGKSWFKDDCEVSQESVSLSDYEVGGLKETLTFI